MTITPHRRRVISLWVDRGFRCLVLAGLCIAVFAVLRDVQTRNLIDEPVRARAHALCVSMNDRWGAYFTAVSAIADKRRPGESLATYKARKIETTRLVRKIQSAVTVDCNKEIQ